jgi:predicted glutamine amidotransferase
MCELLGIAAKIATDVDFSFTFKGFAMRGGKTGPHADGWGLSMYQGPFARSFLEPYPAHSSVLARFLRSYPLHSSLAIAHVRLMTVGEACIENTHPFQRVMHRRHISFAHNGTLHNVHKIPLKWESTLGTTDSEHVFCVMLEELHKTYPNEYPKDPLELGKKLFDLGNQLGNEGDDVFNFLFADGEYLYARCGDNLSMITRRAPFDEATLVDADVTVHLGEMLDPEQRVTVVATEPLTTEDTWQKAKPGTLWVIGRGEVLGTFQN